MLIFGIKLNLVFLSMLVLLVFTMFIGCTEETPYQGEDFSFRALSGETKHLSDYAGTVIVLDCMAVNCQPCLREMLELKKVSENYSPDDVMILSIDVWVSSGETAVMLQDMIDAFHNQVNLTLDWTFGLDDTNGTIQKIYASQGVPTLYIFDKKGNIYYSHVGYETYSELSLKIDEVLNKA